jgi:hypothetical protein
MNRGSERTIGDGWSDRLFRPLLVGVMVGCIAWSLGQLLKTFFPDWSPIYLTLGCVLAAWEGFYSYGLLNSRRLFSTHIVRYRLVELLAIFLFLKLGRFLSVGLGDAVAEVRTWPAGLSGLFDLETLVAFFLAVLFWAAATETARDLKRIGEPPERREDAASPIERLTARFFAGGVVLLIAAGLTRLQNASELLDLRRPPSGGVVLNVLLYFLLGLVMLGQVRFVALLRQWQRQRAEIADDLPARWVRYSLVFVGVGALMAFLLPTGFTLNSLNVIAGVLGVVATALLYLGTLVVLPFGVLAWLISMFVSGGESAPPPAPEFPTFEPPATLGDGGPSDWLMVARTLIFWAVLLGGVFFVLRSYLRDRPELWQTLRALRPIQALSGGLRALWHWLRGWGAQLGLAVGERLPRLSPRKLWGNGKPVSRPFRFFRLGALSSRERVLYYYLSIVRRAGKQGFPRQGHQTPQEYSHKLASHLPQAEEDMGALTQAFVEARYSQGQDQDARVSWKRVRAALQSLKRGIH